MVLAGQIIENVILIHLILLPEQSHFAGTGNTPKYFKIRSYCPLLMRKVPLFYRSDTGAQYMKWKCRYTVIQLKAIADVCILFIFSHKIQVSHFLHKIVY